MLRKESNVYNYARLTKFQTVVLITSYCTYDGISDVSCSINDIQAAWFKTNQCLPSNADPPRLPDELRDLPLISFTAHNFEDIPTQDKTPAAAAEFDTAPTNLLEVMNSTRGKI